MFELKICIICLKNNVRLHKISGSKVQDVFEKLTNKVQEDGYLHFACYICYHQLNNCQQLVTKSQKSEELLKRILPISSELHRRPISFLDRLTHGLVHSLAVTNIQSLQIPEYNEFIKTERQDESDTKEEIFGDGSDVECVKSAPAAKKVKLGENSNKKENIFDTETNTAPDSNNLFLNVTNEKSEQVLGKSTFICNDCGKTCETKAVLIKHISRHKPVTIKPNETNIKNWKSKCEKKYKSEIKANDSSNKNLPYKCKYCNYTSAHNGNLKKHIETHTNKKQFKCQYCSYTSTNGGHLKIHIRAHTGEKPFQCQYCSFTCAVNSTLKNHIKIHTGEKPFKCQYCNYTCTQRGQLKIHIRNHTGEKPFQCQHCSYKCADNSNFKVHIRTHTGEKPFKCQYCSYTCTQSFNLKKHIRFRHGENLYKI